MRPGINIYGSEASASAATTSQTDGTAGQVFLRVRRGGLHGSHSGHRAYITSSGHGSSFIDATAPRNKKQLRSFLGLAGFFQRYIPHYANLTAPLTDTFRKGRDFNWDTQAETAFQGIKKIMCNQPILLIADYSKPFTMFIDASNVAIGAELMQKDKRMT